MSSLFINMALLETIRSKNAGYFVDHFINFLAVAIDSSNVEELTIDSAQKLFEREFDFKIPQASVGLILSRASKKSLLKKTELKYFPNLEKIKTVSNKFSRNKENLISAQKQLFSSFAEYVKSNHGISLTELESEELLLGFFKKYQVEIIQHKIDNPIQTSVSNIKNPEFLISSFITAEAKLKGPVYDHIELVIKGYFIANFINIRGAETDTNNLKGLTAVLDTPILMGISGFNGRLRTDACLEMIKLGQSLGVNFVVFEHIYEEWESIFNAWVNDLRNRNFKAFNSSTLALLQAKGVDAAAIESLIPRLRNNLEKISIKIIDRPIASINHSIDEAGLMAHLKSVGMPDTNGRLERDVKTVAGIVALRKGKTRLALHEKPTVFITTNSSLIREVNSFLSNEISNKSISIVASDIWLTNICWMLSPDVFPNLPNQYLIANCYSAMNADDKFWDSFLTRLRRLKSENKVTSEDYKLVRYEMDLKHCIKDISVITGLEFSDEAALQAVKDTKNKMLHQKNGEIERLLSKKQKALDKISNISNFLGNLLSYFAFLIITLLFIFVTYTAWKNQDNLIVFILNLSISLISLYYDVSLIKRRFEFKIKISAKINSKLISYFEIEDD